MIDENSKPQVDLQAGALFSRGKLDGKRVTVVYTMHHHLGDFVVIGGLLIGSPVSGGDLVREELAHVGLELVQR